MSAHRGTQTTLGKLWQRWLAADDLEYVDCASDVGLSLLLAVATDGYKLPFVVMNDLLRKQDRNIVFSVCNFGRDKPWLWAGEIGNCWRTGGDIGDQWSSMKEHGSNQAGIEKYARPGA